MTIVECFRLPTPDQSAQFCIVLVNTRNPLNIGAAARAMSNFGFDDLRLVQPFEPSFREARSAVGAAEILKSARAFGDLATAVSDCSLVVGTTAGHGRELQHELRPLAQAVSLLRRQAGRGRVALLFGSEKRGLSNKDFSHCHWLLQIPTREEHGSMNLGQAVAVCLYELRRGGSRSLGKTKPGGKTVPANVGSKTKLANAGELERITESLLETLRSSGYMAVQRGTRGGSDSLADEKVRRLVRRLRLSSTDAELLLGMLRKVSWKVGGGVG
jgi:tRNA/rRNA methyltransferase